MKLHKGSSFDFSDAHPFLGFMAVPRIMNGRKGLGDDDGVAGPSHELGRKAMAGQ